MSSKEPESAYPEDPEENLPKAAAATEGAGWEGLAGVPASDGRLDADRRTAEWHFEQGDGDVDIGSDAGLAPPSPATAPPPLGDGASSLGDSSLYSSDPAGAAFPMFAGDADQNVEATVLRSRRRQGRTVARELVETLLLALLVFLAVRASFQNFKVDGHSMDPTLQHGEFLIVNKLVYSEVDIEKLERFLPFLDAGDSPTRYVFHGPERGDIIVLRDPRQPEVDLIKRVIGLPGETVEIVDGHVFINGRLLEEPYIEQPWNYTGAKVQIGADEYYVMGDNRENSKDSRTVGNIPKDLIIGKAMLTYWPASEFGLAPNEAPTITSETVEAYREKHGLAAAR